MGTLKNRAEKKGAAFSLIELMAVIAIIVVLSALGTVAFKNIGRASGARGASDLAASIALSARLEAMSFGNGARIVIDADGGNDRVDNRFRRIGVFRNEAEVGEPAKWVMVGKMSKLPAGVYFMPEYSEGFVEDQTHDIPGKANAKVIVYEFNSAGQLASPNGARLVFSNNIMEPDGTLQNPPAMLLTRSGFVLRRNGRPAFFNHPDQMEPL